MSAPGRASMSSLCIPWQRLNKAVIRVVLCLDILVVLSFRKKVSAWLSQQRCLTLNPYNSELEPVTAGNSVIRTKNKAKFVFWPKCMCQMCIQGADHIGFLLPSLGSVVFACFVGIASLGEKVKSSQRRVLLLWTCNRLGSSAGTKTSGLLDIGSFVAATEAELSRWCHQGT